MLGNIAATPRRDRLPRRAPQRRPLSGSAIVVFLTFPRTAPARPSSRISRSTVQRATGDALAVELQPDLACAVDAEVLPVHPSDLDLQVLVALRRGNVAARLSRS